MHPEGAGPLNVATRDNLTLDRWVDGGFMITDPVILADVQAAWAGVRSSKDRITRNLAAGSGGIGAIGPSHEFRNLAYALCLLFAFSVLEHALLALRDQGVFGSHRSQLGPLMAASRAVLPWQDYGFVDQGRNSRNQIAHQQVVIERAETWRFIEAIEVELRAWHIVM